MTRMLIVVLRVASPGWAARVTTLLDYYLVPYEAFYFTLTPEGRAEVHYVLDVTEPLPHPDQWLIEYDILP